MNRQVRRRLLALTAQAPPIAAKERARIVQILREHGADPDQALTPDGTLIANGETHQYIAVLKTASELAETRPSA